MYIACIQWLGLRVVSIFPPNSHKVLSSSIGGGFGNTFYKSIKVNLAVNLLCLNIYLVRVIHQHQSVVWGRWHLLNVDFTLIPMFLRVWRNVTYFIKYQNTEITDRGCIFVPRLWCWPGQLAFLSFSSTCGTTGQTDMKFVRDIH